MEILTIDVLNARYRTRPIELPDKVSEEDVQYYLYLLNCDQGSVDPQMQFDNEGFSAGNGEFFSGNPFPYALTSKYKPYLAKVPGAADDAGYAVAFILQGGTPGVRYRFNLKLGSKTSDAVAGPYTEKPTLRFYVRVRPYRADYSGSGLSDSFVEPPTAHPAYPSGYLDDDPH